MFDFFDVLLFKDPDPGGRKVPDPERNTAFDIFSFSGTPGYKKLIFQDKLDG